MYTKIEKAAIELLAARPVLLGGEAGASLRLLRSEVERKHPGAVARAVERLKLERDEARFKGNVPGWMKRLVRKHGAKVTSFTARRSAYKTHTSGYCYSTGDITVTLGSDEVEQKIVVLHELAHLKDPWDQHGKTFYKEWRRLLVAAGLLWEAQKRYRENGQAGYAHALRRAGS